MLQFIKGNYPMILIFLGAVLSAAGGVLFQVKSSRTSKQIIEMQDKALKNITGGDSFCYLRLTADGNFFVLIHEGEYPLYDVSIRIVDEKLFRHGNIQERQSMIGTIIPKSVVMIPYPFAYANNDRATYQVFFTARNGMFSETLELKKINGQWKSSVYVSQGLADYGEIKPFSIVDEGFDQAEHNSQ